ncbi:MAG: LPS export ABC transporter periplasmic protein LptC [Immundisolibacteraceae bacterium]|nr:LPS export ABC transporter periplasmic protein LptC [Immundisolibacteraceae bacterium]
MKFSIPLPARFRHPQVVLVIGLLFTWWLLQSPSTETPDGIQKQPHRADFWATNFTTLALDINGEPSYQLTAREMVHFRDDGTTEFDHPDYLRHRQAQGPVQITADSGWNNEDGSQMVLLENVLIISRGEGEQVAVTAKMDELTLYPNDDFAETASPVEINSTSGVTTGIGMHVNSLTGKLVLLSNVRGIYETTQ